MTLLHYFFDLTPFYLEARAEILEKFCWYFGPNDDTKRTLWNQLTFSASWTAYKLVKTRFKSRLQLFHSSSIFCLVIVSWSSFGYYYIMPFSNKIRLYSTLHDILHWMYIQVWRCRNLRHSNLLPLCWANYKNPFRKWRHLVGGRVRVVNLRVRHTYNLTGSISQNYIVWVLFSNAF